jgi:hypothetical protein
MAFLAPAAAISPVGSVVQGLLKSKGRPPSVPSTQTGRAIPSTVIRGSSLVNPTQSPQAPPGSLINKAKFQY